ncbi:XPG domain containing-domain-containing protein [Hypoxylon trugodes]|uniref:XPG domain containing-domain-containing protein n=1 Tax=Hypoxylon trugodes TaxID=326681 RepID=UPI002192B127|nr:XPG domain containing-domain-containing protein [Hypoxylon trugodes]KAI1383381.1 XPG domain containing-domain-containing protein [Hypoxylon trugodes]
MGIRGFGQAVQKYGVFSSLSGDSVVIDGPALVHRISDACMKLRPSTCGFVCHPPYSILSQMVIGWLDELKRHNVNVRKIYFDGYLPPSKWDVRRERLLKQSQNMKALMSSGPSGSPKTPQDAFGNLEASIALTRIDIKSSQKLPKPPFMIPAVLEALRRSEAWGHLVLVVPGEADMFCAQDVRENGGTLLTSDSDLLIQDLGKGNVSFFWDVVPTDHTSKELGIRACKMSLHDINERLGLINLGGLPRVAFEKQRTRMDFDTAVQKARDSREDTLNSKNYRHFIEELELKEYIPRHHAVLGILSDLDPRISEVIIQTLLLEEAELNTSTLDTKTQRGPETLSIFLPVMIENRDKKSAWTMSTDVREIAYSILQSLINQKASKIIEYRTLDPTTALAGREVTIPEPEETINSCVHLVAILDQLAQGLPAPDLSWLGFAVYLDVESSISEQRPSLSAALVSKAASQLEDLDEMYSWDLIHFTAQVHACLYSLRIQKQILDVAVFMGQDLPTLVQELHNRLASLPLIAEWPTVESMFDLLSRFGNAKGLEKIAGMLGISSIVEAELSTNHPEPRKRQRGAGEAALPKGSQQDTKRPRSINPFAILSQAAQDA